VNQPIPEIIWVVFSPSGEIKATTRFHSIALWNKQRGDRLLKFKRPKKAKP